jgi:hypothetical protein
LLQEKVRNAFLPGSWSTSRLSKNYDIKKSKAELCVVDSGSKTPAKNLNPGTPHLLRRGRD